jgi:hypothetical protein
MALEQAEEGSAPHEQAGRRLEGDRGGGEGAALVGHDRAHRIARTEDLEDDLLA